MPTTEPIRPSTERWKRAAPQVLVMTSPPGDARTPDALTAFLNNWPFELLDGPYDLSAETVAAAKALGTQIWADIQNPLESPAQWEPAIARGLTGLQSDHPDALVAYLKATKRREEVKRYTTGGNAAGTVPV